MNRPLTSNDSIQKKLRFHRYDKVLVIPHLDDLSDDEVDATWYSKREYQEIRQSCLRTVRLMEQKEKADHNSLPMEDDESLCDSDSDNDGQDRSSIPMESCCCFRGLEKHCSKDRVKRKSQQELSYRVVRAVEFLAEQKGITLTAMMSERYGKSCAKAALEARLVALKDEQEVRNMMNVATFPRTQTFHGSQ
jgi:hypothetical protein